MVGEIGIQAHSISAEEEIPKRQYRQVARRVNQNRIDQENPVGRCGEGGRFDLVIVIRVVHSRLAGRNTGASRRPDN